MLGAFMSQVTVENGEDNMKWKVSRDDVTLNRSSSAANKL